MTLSTYQKYKAHKIIPTTSLVDAIYYKHIYSPNKMKPSKELYYSDVSDKKHNGKLSNADITMIKYLSYTKSKYQIKQNDIAKYYNVSAITISQIKNEEIFSKHLAEFESLLNGVYKKIDIVKLKQWEMDNENEITSILKSINNIILCNIV